MKQYKGWVYKPKLTYLYNTYSIVMAALAGYLRLRALLIVILLCFGAFNLIDIIVNEKGEELGTMTNYETIIREVP